eukprot:TRINITY_DN4810_c0_g1_i10.p1 TRINITY_DN4810_c0_g1~~TRINITY_DN4810_c0_g1_i10.p1  ORF type:complete len:887 (+),score=274.35 TRINITY_DN4810_c0_g1_i10:990-3650(+)
MGVDLAAFLTSTYDCCITLQQHVLKTLAMQRDATAQVKFEAFVKARCGGASAVHPWQQRSEDRGILRVISEGTVRTLYLEATARAVQYALADLTERTPGSCISGDGTFKVPGRVRGNAQALHFVLGERHDVVAYAAVPTDNVRDVITMYVRLRQRLVERGALSDVAAIYSDRCCDRNKDPSAAPLAVLFGLDRVHGDGFHFTHRITSALTQGNHPLKAQFATELGRIIRRRHEPDEEAVAQALIEAAKQKGKVVSMEEARQQAMAPVYQESIRTIGDPGDVLAQKVQDMVKRWRGKEGVCGDGGLFRPAGKNKGEISTDRALENLTKCLSKGCATDPRPVNMYTLKGEKGGRKIWCAKGHTVKNESFHRTLNTLVDRISVISPELIEPCIALLAWHHNRRRDIEWGRCAANDRPPWINAHALCTGALPLPPGKEVMGWAYKDQLDNKRLSAEMDIYQQQAAERVAARRKSVEQAAAARGAAAAAAAARQLAAAPPPAVAACDAAAAPAMRVDQAAAARYTAPAPAVRREQAAAARDAAAAPAMRVDQAAAARYASPAPAVRSEQAAAARDAAAVAATASESGTSAAAAAASKSATSSAQGAAAAVAQAAAAVATAAAIAPPAHAAAAAAAAAEEITAGAASGVAIGGDIAHGEGGVGGSSRKRKVRLHEFKFASAGPVAAPAEPKSAEEVSAACHALVQASVQSQASVHSRARHSIIATATKLYNATYAEQLAEDVAANAIGSHSIRAPMNEEMMGNLYQNMLRLQATTQRSEIANSLASTSHHALHARSASADAFSTSAVSVSSAAMSAAVPPAISQCSVSVNSIIPCSNPSMSGGHMAIVAAADPPIIISKGTRRVASASAPWRKHMKHKLLQKQQTWCETALT